MKSVYCAVRTQSSHIFQVKSQSLKGFKIHQGYMETEYVDGKTKTLTSSLVSTLGK